MSEARQRRQVWKARCERPSVESQAEEARCGRSGVGGQVLEPGRGGQV